MRFIADLHIHSHFSRATSRTLDPENLSLWAQKKGISVVGTGDFTHPGWVSELEEKLVASGDGLFQLRPDLQKDVDSRVPRSCRGPTKFLLSGEISCIYKKNGKTRKVHHLILMPDMASVIRLNQRLDRIGNIRSDGRPILGLDSRDLLEITLETDEDAFFIPAHVWTPWFSVFGSKSGFDTLEECFEDLTGCIHALETGLSSDPPMNRRLSMLDDYLLVSNSDAHSPAKLGREANIFDTDITYSEMIRAMTDGRGFLGTIEFYPEEGKYHLDGHRKCGIRFEPAETRAHGGKCPSCGKPLTVGVLNRVDELSDRDQPNLSKDFFSLVPLPEVLSLLLDCGPSTKKVSRVYEKLLSDLGPELGILMDTPLSEIKDSGGPLLAEAIGRIRQGRVIREGGYDGEYGRIRVFRDSEKQAVAGQLSLFAQQAREISRGDDGNRKKRKVPPGKKKKDPPEPPPERESIQAFLNPEQQSAVFQDTGSLIVVAGPGTGKTLALTHRIARLIREDPARSESILALTFTRKAAREMARRITDLIPGVQSARVYMTTFHGFCLDLLRTNSHKTELPPGFTLCSETDAVNLVRKCLDESGRGTRSIRRFMNALPEIRAASVLDSRDTPPDQGMVRHFEKYQRMLRSLGMLDFDDLEVETLRLLRNHEAVARHYAGKFPWIFVDEYQDTNRVQVEILKAIVSKGPVTLWAIGDPDQAIYGFRGADVENFHRFHADFPGSAEVTLGRNYRSTESILKGASAVMKKAAPLQCETPGDTPIFIASCHTDAEEAEMIVEQVEKLLGGTTYFSLDSGRVASHEGETELSMGDMGILYRLNSQGDALEKALNRAGIPLVRSGEAPLVNQYPVNIVWRFLQTVLYPDNPYYAHIYDSLVKDNGITETLREGKFNPSDPLPAVIERVVAGHHFESLSENSVEALKRLNRLAGDFHGNMAAFLDRLSLERGIDHESLMGDRVALMSLHAAKGLEWPVVFITGCEDKLLPCTLFGSHDSEEERRLFYVGMTRARKRLILSHVRRRSLNGHILDMNPSPFLAAIPETVRKPLDRGEWKPRKRPHRQLKLF